MFMIIMYRTKHKLNKKDWEERYPIDQICEEEYPYHPMYFADKHSAWKQLEEWGVEKDTASFHNIDIVGVH